MQFGSHGIVRRDLYPSLGERLLAGLLTLLGLAFAVTALAELARALLPVLITATVAAGLGVWFFGRRSRRW